MRNCEKFQSCSCPICLLDPDVETRGWFYGEDVCRKYHAPEYVKAQRKIKSEGYFTFAMLGRGCAFKSRTKGIDPETGNEEVWMKNHPPKRVWTEEEKNAVRTRLRKSAA